MLALTLLSAMLAQCAPQVGSRTMTALIRVESGGDPLLIRDNTLSRTFRPHDASQGVVWAKQLLALGHSIDIGIAQINDANLAPLDLTLREAFDPCMNMRGGATILASDYRAAAHEFGPGQFALRRAIGAYNSGSLYSGYAYVERILAAAGMGAPATIVPDLRSIAFPSGANGAHPRPLSMRQLRSGISAARSRSTAATSATAPASVLTPFNSTILVGAPQGASGITRIAPETSPIVSPESAPTPVALHATSAESTRSEDDPIVETLVGPSADPAPK